MAHSKSHDLGRCRQVVRQRGSISQSETLIQLSYPKAPHSLGNGQNSLGKGRNPDANPEITFAAEPVTLACRYGPPRRAAATILPPHCSTRSPHSGDARARISAEPDSNTGFPGF